MSTYDRPWKSFAEQLELLKRRGMTIVDDASAIHFLSTIGYYRLSAYWYPFRQIEMTQDTLTSDIRYARSDTFYQGTTFGDCLALYEFDKALRPLIFSSLERIEVTIRVDIAHLLGKRNTFAHHCIDEFQPTVAKKLMRSGRTRFSEWESKYGSLVNRSKEDFVKHYREHHGGQLPIWVTIETWDFGTMSQLFAMMKVPDKVQIASKYGLDWRVLQSWLRSLNYLRNLVAHHSRVWNRNIIDQPRMPKSREVSWCDACFERGGQVNRVFVLLAIIRHFLNVISDDSDWRSKVAYHILNFPKQQSEKEIQFSEMGGVKAGRIGLYKLQAIKTPA
ncbi:Abi family protein [Reinekea marinisedimentorum]|uniref:Abortive infection bacteriophage resistance protein n=1 Tax=Reinekea marinisedimentorum TaxID=230495 RepID=A0A4R3ICI5_9GAMM|nr:Abi family protein [Reinekea marinisedimentorum]TCS43107.1 abortive infection bacteriophage resistance protein [Reinekea marinisedimentorum]